MNDNNKVYNKTITTYILRTTALALTREEITRGNKKKEINYVCGARMSQHPSLKALDRKREAKKKRGGQLRALIIY